MGKDQLLVERRLHSSSTHLDLRQYKERTINPATNKRISPFQPQLLQPLCHESHLSLVHQSRDQISVLGESEEECIDLEDRSMKQSSSCEQVLDLCVVGERRARAVLKRAVEFCRYFGSNHRERVQRRDEGVHLVRE